MKKKISKTIRTQNQQHQYLIIQNQKQWNVHSDYNRQRKQIELRRQIKKKKAKFYM